MTQCTRGSHSGADPCVARSMIKRNELAMELWRVARQLLTHAHSILRARVQRASERTLRVRIARNRPPYQLCKLNLIVRCRQRTVVQTKRLLNAQLPPLYAAYSNVAVRSRLFLAQSCLVSTQKHTNTYTNSLNLPTQSQIGTVLNSSDSITTNILVIILHPLEIRYR